MTDAKKEPSVERPMTRLSRLLVFDELRHVGVLHSRRNLDRLEVRGLFPKRVAMGVGKVGWVADEVVAYVDALIAARSQDVGTLGSGDYCRRKPARLAPLLGKAATDAANKRQTVTGKHKKERASA